MNRYIPAEKVEALMLELLRHPTDMMSQGILSDTLRVALLAEAQEMPAKGHCETCGTKLIEDCPRCGAPNCCPKCCHEATAELKAAIPVPAPPAEGVPGPTCAMCGGIGEIAIERDGLATAISAPCPRCAPNAVLAAVRAARRMEGMKQVEHVNAIPAFIEVQAELARAEKKPRLPERKPEGYGVHLSKAERKGKTWQELQALRRGKGETG